MGKKLLVVMVGTSGSGKSVEAEIKASNYGAELVSTDCIREILLGDASDQSQGNRVFEFAYNLTRYYLYWGKDVVFDATNLIPKYRKKVLACADGLDVYKVACVMTTPKEECIRRDSERSRQVKEEVIERQFEQFIMPTCEEGFDEIREI